MRKIRNCAQLLVVSSALSSLACGGAANGSDPNRTDPPDKEAASAADDVSERDMAVMRAQEPLIEAAGHIRRAVPEESGFAGIELQADAVVLWWKGDLPDSMREPLARARAIVPVNVMSAMYSSAELRAASAKITDAMIANPKHPIHSVSSSVDGSGLIVTTEPDVEASAIVDEEAISETAGRALVKADSGVAARIRSLAPVRWERGTPIGIDSTLGAPVFHAKGQRSRTSSRFNDYPKFWGGGKLTGPAGCTTGFAFTYGVGGSFMLTAGHCGSIGDSFYNGDGSWYIGSGDSKHAYHDVLLIYVPEGANPKIFTSDNGYRKVTGYERMYTGEKVCYFGTTSGLRCNLTVTSETNYSFTYEGHTYGDLTKINGDPTQGGDSGGPVFWRGSSSNAIVLGTITGGNPAPFAIVQDVYTAMADFSGWPITMQ